VNDLTADGPAGPISLRLYRPNGVPAAEAPREGVRVDTICYGGMIHGFVPMGRLIETGNRAVAHIAASLRQTLQPGWEAMKGVAP